MRHEPDTLITTPRALCGRRNLEHTAALVLVWSRVEPERIGEAVLFDPARPRELVLGRLPRTGPAATLYQQRPAQNLATGGPRSLSVSRDQWRLRASADAIEIENLGQRALLHQGVEVSAARAVPGELVEIADEMVFLVARRPFELGPMCVPPSLTPRFGEADQHGIVGESPAAWELRRLLAFAAGRSAHVLITGDSGTGKELAARTIHALSARRAGRLIARNAATIPDSLVDAELFGNARDYPNPGMPERPGLIGAADGSTLFLDEIGELPHALQAHLLRVVDAGEYQRLGEARARHADVRVIAATNRAPAALKHDLLARLALRVHLPGLEDRREDIPLVARHLVRELAARDPDLAPRVLTEDGAHPAWSGAFVSALTAASYPTHVRELRAALWKALEAEDRAPLARALDLSTAAPPARRPAPPDRAPPRAACVDPQSLTSEQVHAALVACGGSRDRTWRALGLRSRHQLVRLMRRFPVARQLTAG